MGDSWVMTKVDCFPMAVCVQCFVRRVNDCAEENIGQNSNSEWLEHIQKAPAMEILQKLLYRL